MPNKIKTTFFCSQCGYESIKWYGKCPECGSWNTFEEHIKQSDEGKKKKLNTSFQTEVDRTFGTAAQNSTISNPHPTQLKDIDANEEQRYHTGLEELDRVLGGGIVMGSLVLVGGDPGIGKSTLMLQICQYLGIQYKILYISGEESARQLKLRANRLHVDTEGLLVTSLTDMETVLATITSSRPDIVIVDSIQTMNLSIINSSTGSVTQVRECTQLLARTAKENDVPIFVIGHVNKDGALAGPKVLEHMVDAVLYFEGDKHLSYRILRAVKNRYGSTNEIGVFEMCDTGLVEVPNPSEMLLSGRPELVPGTCVACIIEGSRPILVEVQALISKTGFGNPRRMTTGFDYNRMCLLLAVLEKRGGYFFGNVDAYINVVGGLDLDEPAADLPVVLSIISAYLNQPIGQTVFSFGELGLSGEVRSVSQVRNRILEAQRLGFKKCILPKRDIEKYRFDQEITIELVGVSNISDIIRFFQAQTD